MTTLRYSPKGFHTITPYFIVNEADKLITFMESVFSAQLKDCDHDEHGKVTHAEVVIGDSIVEISEAREQYPAMQNAIHIYVQDTDACYHRALEAGAASLYEPDDMPYGERSGGVKDPFGNHWYIATALEGRL